MPSPVVDIPGSHSHWGRQEGIKDMITKLCEKNTSAQRIFFNAIGKLNMYAPKSTAIQYKANAEKLFL